MRALLIVLFLTSSARADETIVGEVVDTTCYLIHEGRGESHRECAVTCVKAGSPAAILDEKTKKLVFALAPISQHHHHKTRPDEKLLPFVGERVKVRGAVFNRAGVKAIVLDSVEKAPAR